MSSIRCQHIGKSSILFSGAIFRGDEHLISCELVYVFADPRTQKSKPVPEALRAILAGYEAREPMVKIEVGPWNALRDGASQVRAEVFEHEQGIPSEMASDEFDPGAVHALARNRLGQPVATARLLQHAPGVGRVGRMAVNRVLRGSHLGRDVLRALLEVASMRGDQEVCLYAQRRAEEFHLLPPLLLARCRSPPPLPRTSPRPLPSPSVSRPPLAPPYPPPPLSPPPCVGLACRAVAPPPSAQPILAAVRGGRLAQAWRSV